MQFYKNHSRKIKYFSLIAVGSSIFWVTFQVRKTREILNGAFDSYIVHVVGPRSDEKRAEPIKIDAAKWVNCDERDESFLARTWKSLKFMYARRLVNLAGANDRIMRIRATKQLAQIKHLHSWQYSLLAHMCDARTVVSLSRIAGANVGYFTQSSMKHIPYKQSLLIHIMRDFLIYLDNNSDHSCISDFLSTAFADVQDLGRVFENYYDHTDQLPKLIKTSDDLLPLCIDSVLHHSSIERYARDIVQQNGLYLLMEIYNHFKNNYEVEVALCTILANISVYPDLLDEIHNSGWVGVLAQWLREDNIRLSVTAGRALANLDKDDKYQECYGRGLYCLYPTLRTNDDPKLDVIFVHGLLGGVFYTWRQRHHGDCTLSIIGKKNKKETISHEPDSSAYRKHTSSDPVIQEYMETLEEHKRMEWDELGSDYEIVSYDIPTYANQYSDGPYDCTGYDKICCNESDTTQCWPKDWLSKDVKNLRIIGVNYETSLSSWASTCPEERKKKKLEERSDDLMRKLMIAGVGSRPIVWVTHSMGGLIVKNILCKASESDDVDTNNLYSKTKGIVFYSTPHAGSRIANLNPPTSLVVMPSVEVQELREESPNLKNMHANFIDLVKETPMKIVSFVETKSTVVTAMKFNFLMVEPHSGNPGVGEYFEIPQDHLSICKPINRESFLYQKVLHLIESVIAEIEK